MKFAWWQWVLISIGLLEIGCLIVKGFFIGQTQEPWGGGNDCNGVKYLGWKSPCCTEHDREYKAGGWIIARFVADLHLSQCLWKAGFFGKIASPFAFVGVRIIGPISFQYGKKREVFYPKA